MDWKLFIGTFSLIFLAELGDKTQLAAMGQTAAAITGENTAWRSACTVFFAASAALVLSTLLAVFVGSVLAKYIEPRTLQFLSGGLFLFFAIVTLYRAIWPEPVVTAEASTEIVSTVTVSAPPSLAKTDGKQSLFAASILELASMMEMSRAEAYSRAAEQALSLDLKKFFLELAQSEQSHASRLKDVPTDAEEVLASLLPSATSLTFPAAEQSLTRVDVDLLHRFFADEKVTADFYAHLAKKAKISVIKQTLQKLADEEIGHAKMIEQKLSQFTVDSCAL